MVVVLLVGAWAVFDFHQKSRRFPDSRLRDLLRYLIFYNIIELEIFLLIYFDSNLTPTQWESSSSWKVKNRHQLIHLISSSQQEDL